MTSFHGDQDSNTSGFQSSEEHSETDRLEMARQIALESLREDHHALELDAKLAFGPAAVLGR